MSALNRQPSSGVSTSTWCPFPVLPPTVCPRYALSIAPRLSALSPACRRSSPPVSSAHLLSFHFFSFLFPLSPTPHHQQSQVSENRQSEFWFLCGLGLPSLSAFFPLPSSFTSPPITSPPALRKGLCISPVYLWWPHSMMFWKMPTLWNLIVGWNLGTVSYMQLWVSYQIFMLHFPLSARANNSIDLVEL